MTLVQEVRMLRMSISLSLYFAICGSFEWKMHWWVLLVCAKTGYPTINGLKSKASSTIKEVIYVVIAFYASYGYTVGCLVFDRDPSFVALERSFPGVKISFYTADLKNRVAESYMQTIKLKKRCLGAAPPYHLPAELELKTYEAAAKMTAGTPNEAIGGETTSYFLVTNRIPEIEPYQYGCCVLAHARSSRDRDQRAEYVIYITEAYRGDHLCYHPIFKVSISRHKIEMVNL